MAAPVVDNKDNLEALLAEASKNLGNRNRGEMLDKAGRLATLVKDKGRIVVLGTENSDKTTLIRSQSSELKKIIDNIAANVPGITEKKDERSMVQSAVAGVRDLASSTARLASAAARPAPELRSPPASSPPPALPALPAPSPTDRIAGPLSRKQKLSAVIPEPPTEVEDVMSPVQRVDYSELKTQLMKARASQEKSATETNITQYALTNVQYDSDLQKYLQMLDAYNRKYSPGARAVSDLLKAPAAIAKGIQQFAYGVASSIQFSIKGLTSSSTVAALNQHISDFNKLQIYFPPEPYALKTMGLPEAIQLLPAYNDLVASIKKMIVAKAKANAAAETDKKRDQSLDVEYFRTFVECSKKETVLEAKRAAYRAAVAAIDALYRGLSLPAAPVVATGYQDPIFDTFKAIYDSDNEVARSIKNIPGNLFGGADVKRSAFVRIVNQAYVTIDTYKASTDHDYIAFIDLLVSYATAIIGIAENATAKNIIKDQLFDYLKPLNAASMKERLLEFYEQLFDSQMKVEIAKFWIMYKLVETYAVDAEYKKAGRSRKINFLLKRLGQYTPTEIKNVLDFVKSTPTAGTQEAMRLNTLKSEEEIRDTLDKVASGVSGVMFGAVDPKKRLAATNTTSDTADEAARKTLVESIYELINGNLNVGKKQFLLGTNGVYTPLSAIAPQRRDLNSPTITDAAKRGLYNGVGYLNLMRKYDLETIENYLTISGASKSEVLPILKGDIPNLEVTLDAIRLFKTDAEIRTAAGLSAEPPRGGYRSTRKYRRNRRRSTRTKNPNHLSV